ncbi:MAG: alpha-glucosidase C-terminal domain-containing protein [Clostridia bacterium]|nr:alpha-glucosidase C-terminal domain-containing protein [Clostridia bacterium]
MLTGVCHNSRLLKYRTPFGAVKTGETVTLNLRVPNQGVKATLRLWINDSEALISGKRKGDMVEFKFIAPFTEGLVWYYFILDTENSRTFYGSSEGSGEGGIFGCPPASYQITVYGEDYETPEWFRESIVYQIMPDRFFRGNTRGGLDRAVYHEKMQRNTIVHESWNEDVHYLPLEGEKFYDPCDFYCGDLQGIREKLPYLKKLGIGCIYINPIFESPSFHRYNTSNYMKIDPILGDESDLEALVKDAGKMGIKIMLDGVFSHTGSDSLYFNKNGTYGENVGAYQSEESPYYDWYEFEEYPEKYRAWWGFKTLPEVNEMTPSYVEFVGKVLDHYSSLGINSWRLDVADELPDDFIAFLRRRLKKNDKDGVLLGEVWEDASNKQGFGARRKYVDGRELDSVMGYPTRDAIFDFLLMRKNAQATCASLMKLRENYPKPFYDAVMNILGSHDTVRALTALGDAPHRDALTREEQAEFELTEEKLQTGRKRMMMAATLLLTLPGVPCIYYGDEVGMLGMADPFNRKPYPWDGEKDEEIYRAFYSLTALRNASIALKKGNTAFAPVRNDVFAMLRTCDDEAVLVLVNRSEEEQSVSVSADRFTEGPDSDKMFLPDNMTELFTKKSFSLENNTVRLVLEPQTAMVLVGKR